MLAAVGKKLFLVALGVYVHGLAGDELINAAVALQAVFKLHCRGRGRMVLEDGVAFTQMRA